MAANNLRRIVGPVGLLFLVASGVSLAGDEGPRWRGLAARTMDDLAVLGPGDIDVATASLVIRREFGDGDRITEERRRIDAMADELRPKLEKLDSLKAKLDHIARYVFVERKYRPARDGKAALLDETEMKRGATAASLATLYVALGERLDIPVRAAHTPGHLVVVVSDGDARLYVETLGRGALHEGVDSIKKVLPAGERAQLAEGHLQPLDSRRLVVLLVCRAAGKRNTGFWIPKGIRLLQKAVAMEPRMPEAHYALGRARRAEGELDEAAKCLRKAVNLSPRYAWAHLELGYTLADKGDFDGAAAAGAKAKKIAPGWARVHAMLAYALEKQGDVDGVVRECREAARLEPLNVEWRIRLGSAVLVAGDAKAAAEGFRKALAIRPHFAPAHYGLARAFDKAGDAAKAEKQFREAIMSNASAVEYHYEYGHFLMRQGKLESAAGEFRNVLLLDRRHPGAYGAIVRCYMRLKDHRNAWNKVKQARKNGLGATIDPRILEMLKLESGREE